MSEPPMLILSPLAGHVYFNCLFDAIDQTEPHSCRSTATVQARAGTPDWACEYEATHLQMLVLHRAFRKGQMASKLEESWQFGVTHTFQTHTHHRRGEKLFSWYLHYRVYVSTTQFQHLQNFWTPISRVQHLTLPERRLKNATFLHYEIKSWLHPCVSCLPPSIPSLWAADQG